MELDELKIVWKELDRKLDRQYALDLERLREQKILRVRGWFGMLTLGRGIQLLAGVGLNALMIQFIREHQDQPHLVVEALMLLAFGFLMMASSIREFQLLGGIDLAAPVIEIQKRLLAVKTWHLTEAYLFGVTGCIVWVPLTLVSFEMLWGADIYLNAPAVVTSFIVSAVICLMSFYAIVVWLRKTSNALEPGRFEKHFVGISLSRADDAIKALALFERDEKS